MQLQAQILTEMAKALASEAPAGWTQIVCNLASVGGHRAGELVIDTPQGRRTAQVSTHLFQMFDQLRSAMFVPGGGVVYSGAITVLSANNGSVKSDFNYNDEPKFPIPAAAYARDLAMFPLEESRRPEWLRSKVAPFESTGQLGGPEAVNPTLVAVGRAILAKSPMGADNLTAEALPDGLGAMVSQVGRGGLLLYVAPDHSVLAQLSHENPDAVYQRFLAGERWAEAANYLPAELATPAAAAAAAAAQAATEASTPAAAGLAGQLPASVAPFSAPMDPKLLAGARSANTKLIVLGAALGLLGLAGVAASILWDLRLYTTIICAVLAVAAAVLIFTSLRRGGRLARLAASPNEPIVRVDEQGITLHGLPTLAWKDVLFVSFLDGREQAAKRKRVPLFGWSSNLAVRAGNASLGGDVWARDAEAWRAACSTPAQRKQILTGEKLPGRTPGGAALFLDVALSEAVSLEAMQVLMAHAQAHGIPTNTTTSVFKHVEFRGQMIQPESNR